VESTWLFCAGPSVPHARSGGGRRDNGSGLFNEASGRFLDCAHAGLARGAQADPDAADLRGRTEGELHQRCARHAGDGRPLLGAQSRPRNPTCQSHSLHHARQLFSERGPFLPREYGQDRHPDARALVERSARYLGCAAVTLSSLFDVDAIVLAGPSFAVAGSIYQSVIQQEVDRRTFARRAHPVRVVPSVNGSDAAAIGGAVLVLQSELTLGRPDDAARPVAAGTA